MFPLTDIPHIAIGPAFEPFRVLEGQTNISLRCNILNYFPLGIEYIWFKADTHNATTLSMDHIYQIDVVRKSHHGVYICSASYGSGKVNTSRSIEVLCRYLYGN